MTKPTTVPDVQDVEAKAQPVAPAAPETPQLTVADLQAVAGVVDLACRRGAFPASELTQVGAAYDKLSKFLAFVEAAAKEAEAQAAKEKAAEKAAE